MPSRISALRMRARVAFLRRSGVFVKSSMVFPFLPYDVTICSIPPDMGKAAL